MGFFAKSTERINQRNKNISIQKHTELCDWLPDNEAKMSMSVLGGSDKQRSAVLNHAIARLYGLCGIIVIHNDSMLEQRIKNFRNYYPDLYQNRRKINIGFVSGTNCIYDPFYGMDESSIVKCIYTMESNDCALRAEGLRQYINILKYNHFPITLQNLCRLCSMNLDRISSEMMSSIPQNIADDIMSILMQNNLHLQVKSDVKMFATHLEGKIWDGETKRTEISIVSAVEQNALLSIKLSSNDKNVLNYLAKECKYLIEKNKHFLLIVDSIILQDTEMQEVVRNTSKQFAIILAGPNHIDMLKGNLDGKTELPDSLAQKIILFSMNSSAIAGYYSEMIGKYEKIEESFSEKEENKNKLFGKYERNISTRKTQDYKFTPEELVRLGNGALMLRSFGYGYGNGPHIVKTLDFKVPDLF